jgi:hypothetical protein
MRPSIKNGLLLHWPILAAICFLPLAGGLRSEPLRAVFAVACVALAVYQFFLYRTKGVATRYISLSLIVLGFAIASVWLALNVVRYYTYDPVSQHSIYTSVVGTQEILLWPMGVVLVLVCIWGPVDLVRLLRRVW